MINDWEDVDEIEDNEDEINCPNNDIEDQIPVIIESR